MFPCRCPSRTPAPTRLTLESLEERVVLDGGVAALQQNIQHIVVIYQENWSFDGLYGNFPGANGLAGATSNPSSLTQVDRLNGQPLSSEVGPNDFNRAYTSGPATLNNPPPPLTSSNTPDPRFLSNPGDPTSPTAVNTLLPYDASSFISAGATTGDIVHRFYQEQSQIDGGKQDQYVTWSDNPGLVMSHFDATNLPEGQLAQQYTMDDSFYHSAYGGSFLNHQFLVSAAAPVYANAPSSLLATVDSTGQLALNPTTGKIVHDGNVTPTTAQAAADGYNGYSPFDKNYAINTIFSKNLAPDFIGNNTASSLLPSQNDSNPNGPNYIQTIGDLLDGYNVSWKWYSGGWDNALAGSPSNPANNGQKPANDPADPNFQWHHQPLAYYDNFAPWLPNGQRNPLSAAHLQDENNLFADLANNTLPSVSFIKQIGQNNEHPGYADLLTGQTATANLVKAIQNSPEWANTAIVITYDENGGRWDSAAPPTTLVNGVAWGDGTRVPAIVISPYAKRGFVDHTEHDTSSILKTIEEDFTNGKGLQNPGSLDQAASDLLSSFEFPGVHVDGTVLNIVGSAAYNSVQISPIGGKTDGSTGLRVTVSLNGHYQTQTYDQAFTAINIYGDVGTGGFFEIDPRISLPTKIQGGKGYNFVQGGAGDTTVALAGTGYVALGNGNDAVNISGTGYSAVVAGNGNDLVTLANGYIRLGNGNDRVFSTGTGFSSVSLGNGNNFVSLGGSGFVGVGNGNNAININGSGYSSVYGGNGNDTVNLTGSGGAWVYLGNGTDTVNGADGNYSIDLGNGNDTVALGSGNNFVYVGSGHNKVSVGSGYNLLFVNDDDQLTIPAGGHTSVYRRPRR